MSKGVIAVVAFVLFSLTHSVYAQDTDGDGLSDADEITLGTDPAVANDTDGDGIFDFLKMMQTVTAFLTLLSVTAVNWPITLSKTPRLRPPITSRKVIRLMTTL